MALCEPPPFDDARVSWAKRRIKETVWIVRLHAGGKEVISTKRVFTVGSSGLGLLLRSDFLEGWTRASSAAQYTWMNWYVNFLHYIKEKSIHIVLKNSKNYISSVPQHNTTIHNFSVVFLSPFQEEWTFYVTRPFLFRVRGNIMPSTDLHFPFFHYSDIETCSWSD